VKARSLWVKARSLWVKARSLREPWMKARSLGMKLGMRLGSLRDKGALDEARDETISLREP
jgi:hypothetical protein